MVTLNSGKQYPLNKKLPSKIINRKRYGERNLPRHRERQMNTFIFVMEVVAF